MLASQAPTRYAVRQVLDQELNKALAQRESAARQARLRSGESGGQQQRAPGSGNDDEDKENAEDHGDPKMASVKRDFFGRVIVERPLAETDANNAGRRTKKKSDAASKGGRVWVTYNEGLNNAVRRPISLEDFLRGF